MEKWWTAHGGAVIAFVGGTGALIASIDPSLSAATEEWARQGLVLIGIAGAVLHAYNRTPNK